ncbi:hypothetical protein [Paraburkholderia acidicola]|uniref:hypothetical protein n=1 Tax=Paraburkholderia acidicola TaxID=1912599 RepID=UPI0010558F92|nr:hypothetical protein [Paraburkholderia acidicola]
MKNCEKRRIGEAADKRGSSAPAQQGLAGGPFYRHLPAAAEGPVDGLLAVFAALSAGGADTFQQGICLVGALIGRIVFSVVRRIN